MKSLRHCLLALCCALATAQTKTATIAEKTIGTTAMPGYFPLYWDAKAGKMWLEISRWNTEFLYLESLPAGLGSNDVGLDRGQTGKPSVVRFERVGPKVLLIEPNYAYRALSDNPAERRAVADSFAQSVLFGFTVEAEEGSRVLVDATSFFLRDVHNVTRRLTGAKQGAFHLDASRSAFYLDRTKSFPRNTEVEVTLTFAGEQPGAFVESVTPTPEAITVREHHSLVELPPPGYQPRALNPNSGFFGIEYFDFATPISEPIRKQFIARHRLQKKDPAAAVSEAVQPIRYYLDPGAPEPIRSALLEGARWWNQAFEAAGFRNAFQVDMLPADADPMDVRYNLIQWVHRSTRGWSYGASITDPRTGEIIKGQVTLGSLRVRQDFLIAEGWLSPYTNNGKVPGEMERMALSRLRQLAAHEVGHTLGLAHNFAASTHDRASVMDYPHPLIKLNAAGDIDLSDAYATGIGDWDKVAINFGYREFGSGADEPARLREILRSAQSRGLTFITDEDSRPAGGAHPTSHLWDNGANAVDELNRMLTLRSKALARFGENSIRSGRPWSTLEEVLVPLYLAHRYQVEAAAKLIGGVNYTYALRGDSQLITQRVPPAEQRRALAALLATIKPETLTLPDRILALIPPRAFDFPKTREDFPQRTGLTFDPISAAESAADLTVSFLLHPQRAARLVEEGARGGVGLGEVVEALVKETWGAAIPAKGLEAEVRRRVAQVVLTRLIMLAVDDGTSPQARAVAHAKLVALHDTNAISGSSDDAQAAHRRYGARQIELYLRDPKQFPMPKLVETPPGQPIGCDWQP